MSMGKSELVCVRLAGCWHCAVALPLPREARSGGGCEKVDVSRRKPDTHQLLVVRCQNSKPNKVRFCQAWGKKPHSNPEVFHNPGGCG